MDENLSISREPIKILKAKDYVFITLVIGLFFTCALIIGSGLLWDFICNKIGFEKGLTREVVEAFTRAALIEELFKFLGFFIAYKKYKINHVAVSMFTCGCFGLIFAVVEKFATFNVIAIVLGLVFPMHILWQLNSGRHFQQFMDAKKEGKKGKAFFEFMMATFFIYLMHGVWDAVISLIQYAKEDSPFTVTAIILFIILMIAGVAYTIFSFIKTIKTWIAYKKEIKALEENETKENSANEI